MHPKKLIPHKIWLIPKIVIKVIQKKINLKDNFHCYDLMTFKHTII